MFDFRKKLALALLAAWIALFALGALLFAPQVISPRLEAAVSKALASDAALASLTPHFQGFTGSFSGRVASVEQLERAYALANEALPIGSLRRQPDGLLVPAPVKAPASPEPTAAPPSPPALPATPEPAPAQTVAQATETPAASPVKSPTAPEPPPAQTVTQATEAPAAASPVMSPAAPEPALAQTVAQATEASPAAPTTAPAPQIEAPMSAPEPAAGNEAALPSQAMPQPKAREVDEWTGTVFFAPDSSTLQESQLPILRRIAEDCRSRTDFRLRVISFADPRGDRDFNSWLSQRRADRVRAELSRLGVQLSVEVAVDFESDHSPVLENPEIQRRVELRYIR